MIAKNLNLSSSSVGIWRKPFRAQGLMDLYDKAKTGIPRTISDEKIARLVQKALNSAPSNRTHWSFHPVLREMKVPKEIE